MFTNRKTVETAFTLPNLYASVRLRVYSSELYLTGSGRIFVHTPGGGDIAIRFDYKGGSILVNCADVEAWFRFYLPKEIERGIDWMVSQILTEDNLDTMETELYYLITGERGY